MNKNQLDRSHYKVLDAVVEELGDFRLDFFDEEKSKLAIAFGNNPQYNTPKEGEQVYVLPDVEELRALGESAETIYYNIVMMMLVTIVGHKNFPPGALQIICQPASPEKLVEAAKEHPSFHFFSERL